MNGFSRKSLKEICMAFDDIPEGKCSLTATIQKSLSKEEQEIVDRGWKNVTFVNRHLTNEEINELYDISDVSIVLSRQEGLGLPFYEPLRRLVPVLTHQGKPHSEIIIEGVNGWTIPCTQLEKMNDNPESLFGSYIFKVEDLTNQINKIVDGECQISKEKMKEDYQNRFNVPDFKQRFLDILKD